MTHAEHSHLPMIVSAEERREMIAVAAYYLAEHRGFAPDGAAGDWLAAEQQIDRMLEAVRRHGITRAQFERAGLRNALQLWRSTPDVEQ